MTRVLTEPHAANGTDAEVKRRTFWPLTLGCMGVVYGDIGTSPLYAFRVALEAAGGTQGDLSRGTVIGVLSLILWALFLVVTAKYVLILLRADNKGEGGTLSLMALAQRALGSGRAQGRGPHSRHDRGGVVLRRRPDHPRHLGVVGRRRLGGRRPAIADLRRAADGDHPHRSLRHAVPRHGRRGRLLRTGDDDVVRCDWCGRSGSHRR